MSDNTPIIRRPAHPKLPGQDTDIMDWDSFVIALEYWLAKDRQRVKECIMAHIVPVTTPDVLRQDATQRNRARHEPITKAMQTRKRV